MKKYITLLKRVLVTFSPSCLLSWPTRCLRFIGGKRWEERYRLLTEMRDHVITANVSWILKWPYLIYTVRLIHWIGFFSRIEAKDVLWLFRCLLQWEPICNFFVVVFLFEFLLGYIKRSLVFSFFFNCFF